MKIVIPGGGGHLGGILANRFTKDGHEVVIVSRHARTSPCRVVTWDAENPGPWAAELDGADVVINLAGRSVNCRYTPENRRQIMDSRVNSTRAVGAAIAQAARPPKVWLQMSTATIYSHRYDAANDEITGILGTAQPDAPSAWRFSIDVATAWENAALVAVTPATRKVLMRTAMVMSAEPDGVFDVLLGLVRRGLGGTAGNGKQFVSWNHEDDFLAAIQWLMENDRLNGVFNLCAPEPLPNAQFMKDLRRAWGTRIGLPAASWMLTLGAVLMRTETELILKSRRVVPTRLIEDGFKFRFPAWSRAAADLCDRSRRRSIGKS